MKTSTQLRMTVYASLMAALTAAGAYLSIPIGPVPIVLQNLFVFLSGLLLGCRWGLASVGVYLLAGALGLPVFAGGAGGLARLVGAHRRIPAGLSAGGLCDRVDFRESPGTPGRRHFGHVLRRPDRLSLRGRLAEGGDRHDAGQGPGGGDVSLSARRCAQNHRRGSHRPRRCVP